VADPSRLIASLQARQRAKGRAFEWADVIRDLEQVQQVEVEHQGYRFWLRLFRGPVGEMVVNP
jgi:hypothetical protein